MKFILYFDVNKTIMMSDPGASISMPAMINSLLSECVWGTVKHDPETLWEMHSPVPSRNPPLSSLVSYGEFLENIVCAPKPERKHKKTNFTEAGFVGEKCREHYDKLMTTMLEMPPTQHIMPAFFHLIVELERRKLDYGLVFRTFGSDSTEIAQEFNSFCRGDHPASEREVEGEGSLLAKCIDMERCVGRICRGGAGGEETNSLRLGSCEEKPHVVEGAESIHHHILSLLFEQDKRSLIIQDDYPYWHARGESDHSGKLMIIDSLTENQSVVQIFFDDNVERDRAHIVDVRSLPGLEEVPFERTNDRLIMRVSPFEVIASHDYFVKTFDEILTRRNICGYSTCE